MNDRGELHCHRTRHRGGRALPVPGCPQGRFPRRSTLKKQKEKRLTLPASTTDPKKIEKVDFDFCRFFFDFCVRLLDPVQKFERLIVQK
jgi:hypothetical protein